MITRLQLYLIQKNSKVLDEIALEPNKIDGHYYVDKKNNIKLKGDKNENK